VNEDNIPIQSYQEEQEFEPLEPQEASFAVIGEVYEDGVSLIFEGNTQPTNKHYKVNNSILFHSGDPVRISKHSNTYIVEFPYGAPKVEGQVTADLAKRALTADDALKLDGKTAAELKVAYASSADYAENASEADTARELTDGSYTYRLGVGNGYIRIYLSGHGWYSLVKL